MIPEQGTREYYSSVSTKHEEVKDFDRFSSRKEVGSIHSQNLPRPSFSNSGYRLCGSDHQARPLDGAAFCLVRNPCSSGEVTGSR
jgi:hypothetical protein